MGGLGISRGKVVWRKRRDNLQMIPVRISFARVIVCEVEWFRCVLWVRNVRRAHFARKTCSVRDLLRRLFPLTRIQLMEESSHDKFGIACEPPFDVSDQITFRAERIGRGAHETRGFPRRHDTTLFATQRFLDKSEWRNFRRAVEPNVVDVCVWNHRDRVIKLGERWRVGIEWGPLRSVRARPRFRRP